MKRIPIVINRIPKDVGPSYFVVYDAEFLGEYQFKVIQSDFTITKTSYSQINMFEIIQES